MITFKEIKLEDKELFQKYFKEENSQQCDYNFGIMYLWKNVWNYTYAIIHDFLVIKLHQENKVYFFMPLGTGDLRSVILEMMDYTAQLNAPFLLVCLEEKHKKKLETIFPNTFIYEASREDFDYICLAEKLTTYPGRALRGKKRPCNHFEKNYKNWHFDELKQEYFDQCLELMRTWMIKNPDKVDEDAEAEYKNISYALKMLKELDLYGGALFVEDRLVAFTLGSLSREDTFDTFFEKAETEVDGAYAMVCREFTKKILKRYPSVIYINREEDMGLDYLRMAKSMSDPVYMITKYIAYLKEDTLDNRLTKEI